jgi:hypothetical protein
MLACNEAVFYVGQSRMNRFLRKPIPSSTVPQLTSTFGNHPFFLREEGL